MQPIRPSMNGSTTITLSTSDTSSTTSSLSSEMDQDMIEAVTQVNDDEVEEEQWLDTENHIQSSPATPFRPPPLSSTSTTTTTTASNNTITTTTASVPPTINNQGDDTNEPHINSDAETQLRKKILQIQRDANLSAKEKARLIQQLMWRGNQSSTPKSDNSSSNTPEPVATEGEHISYQNEEKGIMGCQHYQRKCKLQANCCGKIFSCRFCHDEVMSSDHTIIRTDTKKMFCMLCRSVQPAGQHCQGCQQEMARYYCDKCKLWDDDPTKSIYHCDDCGICRQGMGLGKDFFHCQKCNICMAISMRDKHRCIERNLESDCPICGEYMFTSTATVIFMPCGHCIHKHCYTEYVQTSYQCPTCLKSLGDMSDYFARLDRELERQTMPSEYDKYISHVFCNDCERRSPAKYHFFYHKCGHCKSYNTTVLRTENTEESTNSLNNNHHHPDSNNDNNSNNNNSNNNHLDSASLTSSSSSSESDYQSQQNMEIDDSPSSTSNTTTSSSSESI